MSTKKDKTTKNEANEPIEKYGEPLNFEKVWLMFQETSKKFEETDKRLDKMFKDTDRQLKEQSQETNKRIKELSNLFTTQWGKLIESLVEGDLVRLLNEKGIKVHQTFQRVSGSYEGDPYEIDIIASNDEEIVVVEVKTTLRPNDIKKTLKKLKMFKTWMPVYKEKKVYGAVAFLNISADSHRMAESKGLFVIKATGNSASIINSNSFEPKVF